MSRLIPSPRLFLFALLSAADGVLTWLLLRHGDGRVYEGNPVAGWCLHACGWPGLLTFKCATVLLVAGLYALVVRMRPGWGSGMLNFACAVVALVVLYSTWLVAHVTEPAPQEPDLDMAVVVQTDEYLERERQRSREYGVLLGQLTEDLIARRCSLLEAAALLGDSDQGRDPSWQELLRGRFAGRSAEENLSANLIIQCAVALRANPAEAERVVRDLEHDFQSSFNAPLPRGYRDALNSNGLGLHPDQLTEIREQ